MESVVADAVEGGVTLVQLREKDLPTRSLIDLAHRLRDAVQPRAALVINGRADVAMAVDAFGVHLPADGLPTDATRDIVGADRLVGRSVHSAAEARERSREPLDYLLLGTIFPSRSHPGAGGIGLDAVRDARVCRAPVVAIGGIGADSAGQAIGAGASGVAVISAILADPRPRDAAQRIHERMAEAWARRPVTSEA